MGLVQLSLREILSFEFTLPPGESSPRRGEGRHVMLCNGRFLSESFTTENSEDTELYNQLLHPSPSSALNFSLAPVMDLVQFSLHEILSFEFTLPWESRARGEERVSTRCFAMDVFVGVFHHGKLGRHGPLKPTAAPIAKQRT